MPTPELAPSTSTVWPGRMPGPTNQHVPRSEKHQRHAGRLVEVERLRNRNHIGGGDRDQFAVAAVDGIAEHGKFPALIVESGDALLRNVAE